MHFWIRSSLDQRADRATHPDRNKTRLEAQHDSWFLQRILWSSTTRKDILLYREEFHRELSRSIWLEKKNQGNCKQQETRWNIFLSFHFTYFMSVFVLVFVSSWRNGSGWDGTAEVSQGLDRQPSVANHAPPRWCVPCDIVCFVYFRFLCVFYRPTMCRPKEEGSRLSIMSRMCNAYCSLLQMMTRCILQIIKQSVRASTQNRWLCQAHCVFLIFSCY